MVICVVKGCDNKSKVYSAIMFHRIPTKRKGRKNRWLAALNIDLTTPVETIKKWRVCSEHFTQDDYLETIDRFTRATLRRLKDTAIPTIFRGQTGPSGSSTMALDVQCSDPESEIWFSEYVNNPSPSTCSTSLSPSLYTSSDEGAPPDSPPTTPDNSQMMPEVEGTRGRKCKVKEDIDIEIQKLDVLKQMAAVCTEKADHITSFGNQVAVELRLVNDPATLSRLKRDIMCLIYDAQDTVPSTPSEPQHQHTTTQHLLCSSQGPRGLSSLKGLASED